MTGPARRRPGGTSPLLPVVESIRTTPHLEETPAASTPAEPVPPARPLTESQTTAPIAEQDSAPATAPTPTPSLAPSQQSASPSQPQAAPSWNRSATSPHGDYPPELDEKKQATLNLRRILKARAETVVLRTAGFEGGYTSWNAFVEGALERELQRMANEFNNGEPFPPNLGNFRQGRPLGS